MKINFENSFPNQIELLPRFAFLFGVDWVIVIEFLFWGITIYSNSLSVIIEETPEDSTKEVPSNIQDIIKNTLETISENNRTLIPKQPTGRTTKFMDFSRYLSKN